VAALRLATRGSPLARVQAVLVAERLRARGSVVELVVVETRADRELEVPISSLAGRGVFVTEVELAVLEGNADAAVHSAKDLPSAAPPEGLVLAAVPERADVRDALVGRSLDELAPGAVVATGAVRRRAQLAWHRPDLAFAELRGNIATRLAKVPAGGAVVVALAALERLGLAGVAAEVLPTSVVLPQVGQGALAIRCREDDLAVRELLQAVDEPGAHRALLAERAFLARLGGGCDAPLGALATCAGPSGPVTIEGMVASADGHVAVRRRHHAADPAQAGGELAELMIALDGVGLLLGWDPARDPSSPAVPTAGGGARR